jgi:hypothetical protein
MSTRGPHRVRRPQAQQGHGPQQLPANVKPAAERAACPALGHDTGARPGMNRQERLIFTVYVVLAILIVLFLAATGVLWWLAR